MNFKITFASQDESFPLELGEVTARIVPADPDLQDKTVTPTESTQTVTCDAPHDGLGTVTVNPIPPEYVIPSGTVELSSNGQHDVSGKAVADVHVSPVLQRKSVTPTRAAQTVEPDSGKDGLSAVDVGGIPSEYVIPTGTVTLSSNGQHDVSGKAVAAVDVQPVLQSKSVTPTRAAQTVTPDSGKDGLSAVEVGGIPAEYVIPTGTKQIAANGVHDVSGFASAEVAVPGPSGQIEITENGEVDVSDFASALVNVAGGGGASNVVTGEFKFSGTGEHDVDIPYTGTGYPIAVHVFPKNPMPSSDKIYIGQKGTMVQWCVFKKNMDQAPTYSGDSADETCIGSAFYKYKSASTYNSFSYSGGDCRCWNSVDAVDSTATKCLFLRNNQKMTIYVRPVSSTSQYAFRVDGEYKYIVVYSE